MAFDVYKYAALQRVSVEHSRGFWWLTGYFDEDQAYHALPQIRRIGKRDDTAVRHIDTFADEIKEGK